MSRTKDCCRCNHGGWCRNCSCRKNDSQCSSCLPGWLGRCENQGVTVIIGMNIDPPNGEHTAHTIALTLHSLDSVDDNSAGIANVVSSDRMINGRKTDIDPTHSDGSTTLSYDHNSTHCVNGSDRNHGASVLRQVVCGLPPYEKAGAPNFEWGEIDGDTSHSTECCYPEVVHWKRNLL